MKERDQSRVREAAVMGDAAFLWRIDRDDRDVDDLDPRPGAAHEDLHLERETRRRHTERERCVDRIDAKAALTVGDVDPVSARTQKLLVSRNLLAPGRSA